MRVNAEDPDRDFLPEPWGDHPCGVPRRAHGDVRVDTHIQAGAAVPPHYDSLLAKVIANGANRGDALAALRDALGRCRVEGVTTNLGLHRALLADAGFAAGGVDTGYLGRFLADAGTRRG